jgi:hypothetical protein
MRTRSFSVLPEYLLFIYIVPFFQSYYEYSLFSLVIMTVGKKHASPQQLLLRETPKGSAHVSSGFSIYDTDIVEWRTFYQSCYIVHFSRP